MHTSDNCACQVLFATCFDEDEFESLGKFLGKTVRCTPAKEMVDIQEIADAPSSQASQKGGMVRTRGSVYIRDHDHDDTENKAAHIYSCPASKIAPKSFFNRLCA
jgi:hypothetical protein